MITVFGKPGCGKCEAAKEKLNRMGFSFEVENIEEYTTLHDGWRTDGSVGVLAAYSDIDDLPLIKVGNLFYTYSGAMRKLKSELKAVEEPLAAVSA